IPTCFPLSSSSACLLASQPWCSKAGITYHLTKKFFLNGIPPKYRNPGKGVKIICQKYQNLFHFVTLYDTRNRLALYSAYKVNPGSGTIQKYWMVELGGLGTPDKRCKLGDDMDPSGSFNIPLRPHLSTPDRSCLPVSQAINEDYANSNYDRGHLNPVMAQNTQVAKEATFTLTNVVPQVKEFNNGKWQNAEEKLSIYAKECKKRGGETFAVTGAVKGRYSIGCGEDCGSWKPPKSIKPNKNKHRVNIPTMMWSAACCRINGEVDEEPFVFWGANKKQSTIQMKNTWEDLHKFENDILQPDASPRVKVKIFEE
uniref:endonuclease domain-containing 1 protein-like n=1 Tax=Myxine glutinosa TaxID=7769 RepID=UPI00358FC7C9